MMDSHWPRLCVVALALTVFAALPGCGRKTLLSSETEGPYTFDHYQVTRQLPEGPSVNQYINISYGFLRHKINFPHKDWIYIDGVARLASAERAWLLAVMGSVSEPGGAAIGLLRESQGTTVQTLCSSEKPCGQLLRMDADNWYVPEETLINTSVMDWNGPEARYQAGQIFNEKTLALRSLALEIPGDTQRGSMVTLTPDGQGGAWLRSDYGSAPFLIIASPHGPAQRLVLSQKWLDCHPRPENNWPMRQRALHEAASGQQWFQQFFEWKMDAQGTWSAHLRAEADDASSCKPAVTQQAP